jgi:hypothetical protein
MKNIILTLFYIGITIGNAWADEPRNQTVVRSRNEQFTFKLKKNNWNMTDSKGNLLYSIPERVSLLCLYLSPMMAKMWL